MDYGLKCTAVDPFLTDWDHVQFWQEPTEHGHVQQRFARQKINRAIAGNASKRWIEITLVIHCQNHWPALNQALRVSYSKTKKKSRGSTRNLIPQPVINVHLNGEGSG